MFERWTEQAENVIIGAQHEARLLGHESLGDEHILLGLLRQRESGATRALASLGITLENAREQLEKTFGRGEGTTEGPRPFRTDVQVVLKKSRTEALDMGCNEVKPDHVLLTLIRGKPEKAIVLLEKLGVTPEQIRDAVSKEMAGQKLSHEIPRKPKPTWDIEYLCDQAAHIAQHRFNSENYGVSHLMLALLENAQELDISRSLEQLFATRSDY